MALYLAELCGDSSVDWSFWSNDYTWNTSRPSLTLCFQLTALQWIPCGFLLLSSLIYFPCLRRRRTLFNGQLSVFSIAKIILNLMIGFLAVLDLLKTITEVIDGGNPQTVLYIHPVVTIVTMIVVSLLTMYIYMKGIHTSAILWYFWLIEFVCGLLILIDQSQRITAGVQNVYRSTTAILTFVLVAVQLVLYSFSDVSALDRSNNPEKMEERIPLISSSEDNINIQNSKNFQSPSPELTASYLSKLLFTWITSLLVLAYRRAITLGDVWELVPKHTTKTLIRKAETAWKNQMKEITTAIRAFRHRRSSKVKSDAYLLLREIRDEEEAPTKKKKYPSIFRIFTRVFGLYFVGYLGFLKVMSDLISFIQPQLLSSLIGFIANPKEYEWHGYAIGLGLFITSLLRTVVTQKYMDGCYVTGMNLRTIVIGLVYRKALRLSGSSRKNRTVGEIVNLMSVDSQIVQEAPVYIHNLWTAPIIIVIAMVFLWQELGASCLAGLFVMIFLIPLNAVVAGKIKKFQSAQMKLKDQRIKLMTEILNGMKVLKLYSWESSFEDKIKDIRNREVGILKKSAYLNACTAVTWFCAPFLVALTTFAVYVLSSSDNILTSQKAFVSLSLFNLINGPLSMLPGVIAYSIQFVVSIGRLDRYLVEEEINPNIVEENPMAEDAIRIDNGNFAWSKDGGDSLKDINIAVPDGKLYAVVGTVGSGKSSLINAILGEMIKRTGRIIVKGRMAYVPQQAWCQNCSLQDNILFGKKMRRKKYNEILEACTLKADLEVLTNGDQTEIGEKGINLSGGQKQRISLARAIYQDADIYLLDDPLSAVDSHVGKHIFEKVICNRGLLANKTRVLVTHGVTYLPNVDCIFVMKDGEISEAGSYSQLLSRNGPFAEFLRTYLEKEMEDEKSEDDDDEVVNFKAQLRRTISVLSGDESDSRLTSTTKSSTRRRGSGYSGPSHHRRTSSLKEDLENLERQEKEKQKKSLMTVETTETGSVKFEVFAAYGKALKMGAFLAVFLSYACYIGFQVGTNIWLSVWSEDTSTANDTAKRDMYLGIYGLFGFLQSLCVMIQSFALAIGTYSASLSLHKQLLNNVLKSPMSFFDTTPIGRIVNRFGKDIDTVDINIPLIIRLWLIVVAGVFGTLIVVSVASPIFLAALIPLSVCYYFAQRFYVCTSRQLKRIDSVRRSPIYSNFQESLVGASSIRAYRRQTSFIDKSDRLVDMNQMVWYPNLVAYRWMGIMLEGIGAIIVLLAAVFAVLSRNSIGPGLAGASVSYAMQVTASLNYSVRMTCDLETYIVAVERLLEYMQLPTESERVNARRLDPNWPEEGRIKFNNYSVRYRPELDLVLRGITAEVMPGERVGIVGRTGAGKSSLTLALFRILEPAGGSIRIDNVDITSLALHDLRSRITIIPQEPVLFSGTLRMNLDPFDSHTDGEVWTALEQAHLRGFVSGLTEGLSYPCSEGGENLSVGQRQLVCLARALLRKTKVLVLDEATAAVDLETDDLIQTTIRKEFKGCTILTIAHRLNTIMDYDRIIVLDRGMVKEFDTPTELLRNENSIFYGMCQDAGLV